MQKLALRTAGLVFLMVAALHTWRFFTKAAVTVGAFSVPMEWSVAGAAVGFVLSLWMFASAR